MHDICVYVCVDLRCDSRCLQCTHMGNKPIICGSMCARVRCVRFNWGASNLHTLSFVTVGKTTFDAMLWRRCHATAHAASALAYILSALPYNILLRKNMLQKAVTKTCANTYYIRRGNNRNAPCGWKMWMISAGLWIYQNNLTSAIEEFYQPLTLLVKKIGCINIQRSGRIFHRHRETVCYWQNSYPIRPSTLFSIVWS